MTRCLLGRMQIGNYRTIRHRKSRKSIAFFTAPMKKSDKTCRIGRFLATSRRENSVISNKLVNQLERTLSK